MRGHYLLVAIALLNFLEEIFEAQAELCAFGKPDGETFTHEFGEGEEFHLFTNLAVVATLGFFNHLKVFVEQFLLGEADAVDAGHHGALFIAAPVGGAYGGYLDGLDGGCGKEVRTTAKVGVGTLGVCGDVAVFEIFDEFVLVGLSSVAEELECIGFGDILANEGFFLLYEFGHLLFNLGEVGFADGYAFGGHNVVVESAFDGGSDAKLHAGPEFLHGFSHQVG